MPLRIAIGACKCVTPYPDSIAAAACEAIQAQLSAWRERLPGDLSAVPTEHYEHTLVQGHAVTFGTRKVALPQGDTLVVFGALVHTWSRPTYITFGAIGRFYAEGLLIRPDGMLEAAPDEVMWEFR